METTYKLVQKNHQNAENEVPLSILEYKSKTLQCSFQHYIINT